MRQIDNHRILLVQDDEAEARALADYLSEQGYQTDCETDGRAVPRRLNGSSPGLALIEAHLAGKDGYEVCRDIRPHYPGYVVIYSARAESVDPLLALKLGADYYVAGTAQPVLVLAHVKAAFRRADAFATAARAPAQLRYGEFIIDCRTRTASIGTDAIPLTTAEFDLLWMLASRAGQVVSRDDIMAELRGIKHNHQSRSIDTRISRLRRLLRDDAPDPERIKTVRGRGYLFSPLGWED